MRLSFVVLLSVLALAFAQEAVVEEEAPAVETEEIDLDALLEETADADMDELIPDAPVAEEEPVVAEEAAEEEAPVVEEAPVIEEEEEEVSETDASSTGPAEETETADATAETKEAQPEETTENVAATEETASTAEATTNATTTEQPKMPEQAGPFIDLLGPALYSLEMIGETQAQLTPQYTNEALKGKKVVGLYFSADWCGPCRKFTPELVAFYEKMNKRRRNDFEIVWVSRCRDMQSYGQYFTHMKWLALPFEEAAGQRGQMLSQKYKVKGIPTVVLLDDLGNVITTDARNKIPQDKAGIGFPWGNPLSTLLKTVFPRSLRLMVKTQVDAFKGQLVRRVKGLVGLSKAKAA